MSFGLGLGVQLGTGNGSTLEDAIASVRSNIPDVTADIGTPVTIDGRQWFTGANPAITAINVVGSLPAGVTQSGFDFTFDPASAGTVTLQVTATNPEGTSATASIDFVGSAVTTTIATITRDGVTVDVSSTEAITDVIYPDDLGPVAIVTSGTVTVTGRTPASDTVSGRAVNGAAKNWVPAIGVNNAQPFDGDAEDYDATLLDDTGTTLTNGDTYLAVASQIDYVSIRRGVLSGYLPIVVTSGTAPNVDDISPAIIGWSGRGALSWDVVDWVAALSSIPKYTITGTTLHDWAALEGKMQFNPGYAIDHRASNGYDRWFPHDWLNETGNTESNWGENTVVEIIPYLEALMLTADPAGVTGPTQAQQIKFLKFLAGLGRQWYDPLSGRNQVITPDGGHHQNHQIPIFIYGHVIGSQVVKDSVVGDLIGNYDQPFYLTQAIIDADLVPHGDADDVDVFDDKPAPWQRRKILAKGFDATEGSHYVDVRAHRGGSGGVQGDPSKLRVNGMNLTDGTNTVLVQRNEDVPRTYDGGVVTGEFRVYLDADPVDFAVDDTIWFEPVVALVPQVEWCITGYANNPSHFTPAPAASYRVFQKPAALSMLVHALGQCVAGWEPIIALNEEVNDGSNPWANTTSGVTFTDYHANDVGRAIWDQHWDSTISLVAQQPSYVPVDLTPPATDVTRIDQVTFSPSGVTDPTLPLATGGAVGDLELVRIHGERYDFPPTIPAGWTAVFATSLGNVSNTQWFNAYYRVLDATSLTETGLSITNTSGNDLTGVSERYTACTVENAVAGGTLGVVNDDSTDGAGSFFTTPTLTGVGAGSQVLDVITARDGDDFLEVPAGAYNDGYGNVAGAGSNRLSAAGGTVAGQTYKTDGSEAQATVASFELRKI